MARSGKNLLVSLACVLFCSGVATVAQADTFTLTNTDSGWYNDQGFHDSTNKNYIAGAVIVDSNTTRFRNFFVFDLSGVSGTITSAQIRLYTATISGSSGFILVDVGTPVADLSASQTNRTDIYDDLGFGNIYALTTLTPTDSGTLITLDLDAAAIAALQSASGGTFAIGGSFNGLTTFAFGGSQADIPDPRNQLILQTEPQAAVPEPTTMLLLGTGLAGLASQLRRRRAVSKI